MTGFEDELSGLFEMFDDRLHGLIRWIHLFDKSIHFAVELQNRSRCGDRSAVEAHQLA